MEIVTNNKKSGIDFNSITLKNDYMFGEVMRKEACCKPFLEMVLGFPIAKLRYLEKQAELAPAKNAKAVRLDIYAADEANTVYNVEMQISKQGDLPKRGRYYQSVIDLDQLNRGHSYRELPRSFVIFVCDFDFYGKGKFLYRFERREEGNGDLLYGDETCMIVMNLGGNTEGLQEMEAFRRYMNSGEVLSPLTRTLEDGVIAVRDDERWRRDMRTLQDLIDEKGEEAAREGYERGMKAGMEAGMEQGIQQGMQQGMEQGIQAGIQAGIQETIRRLELISQCLVANGREAELSHAIGNLEQYLLEFGIK